MVCYILLPSGRQTLSVTLRAHWAFTFVCCLLLLPLFFNSVFVKIEITRNCVSIFAATGRWVRRVSNTTTTAFRTSRPEVTRCERTLFVEFVVQLVVGTPLRLATRTRPGSCRC